METHKCNRVCERFGRVAFVKDKLQQAGMAKHTLKRKGEAERAAMWYVIQVRTGTEEEIQRQCENIIDKSILEKSFIPKYEQERKYQREWHTELRVLFPGYVFLVSDEKEKLFFELKRVIGLTKLLGTGETIVPLTNEEVNFLLRLGGEEQTVEMSEGIIENDRVVVLSGPLKGNEGLIRKIDRHKRKALLEIEMFGRTVEMQVGLEVVGKR